MRDSGIIKQLKGNSAGGAIAATPVVVWLAQEYGVPVDVVATLLTWAGVWLRGLVK